MYMYTTVFSCNFEPFHHYERLQIYCKKNQECFDNKNMYNNNAYRNKKYGNFSNKSLIIIQTLALRNLTFGFA